MHPNDPELQALADGELSAAEASRVGMHVEACDACAPRLRSLESADRRIAERLRLLDHPVPNVDPTALMLSGRRYPAGRVLLAASVAAVFAATAAAAVIPGSPVRHLAERAIAAWSGREAPTTRPPEAEQRPPLQSGVAFVPAPELEIVFLRPQAAGTIRISLVDGHEVRVRELGGAAAYAVDPARLVVDNARGGDGSYEILLPRGLGHVRVRIGDHVVFEKDGASISSRGSETYVVPFAADIDLRPPLPPNRNRRSNP